MTERNSQLMVKQVTGYLRSSAAIMAVFDMVFAKSTTAVQHLISVLIRKKTSRSL